jgi:hypothetical protein
MRIFFRSIMGPDPTDDDFKSYAALGRRPRQTDPEFLERSGVVESEYGASRMQVVYEVWDFETRNIINSFETEDAALVFLRRLLALNGSDGVRELAIMRQTPDASGAYEPTLTLEGPALLTRLGVDEEARAPSARRAAS